MIGTYRIIEDGVPVAEQKNVITDSGKRIIREYLSGARASTVRSLAIGIGETPATATDGLLEFSVSRADVNFVGVVNAEGKITFKTFLPDNLAAKVYEIGAWPSGVEEFSPEAPSTMIAFFDDQLEDWSGTFNAQYARIGSTSVLLSYNNSTAEAENIDLTLDLSAYSNFDTFSLALQAVDDVDGFSLRLGSDSTNYFEYSYVPSLGYTINKFNKSDFTTVGTPDWSDINYTRVAANSAVAGSVYVDGLRIDDQDSPQDENLLLSRTLLSTPFEKLPGRTVEVEYTVEVNL